MRVKILSVFVFVLVGIFLIQNVCALTHITDCNGLSSIRNVPSESYVLDNSFSCGAFVPIASFTETLDGQGFIVSGITIGTNLDHSGLFATTNGATIKNLVLSSLTLTNTYSGSSYVGGLIGEATSTTIQNVGVSGSVTENNLVGGSHVGGMIGFGHSIFVNKSYAKVNVLTNGEDHGCAGTYSFGCVVQGTCKVGGFAGKVDGTNNFINDYSSGSVKSSPGYMGGFIGSTYSPSGYTNFTNVYATDSVNNVNRGSTYCWAYAGSFVGYYENPNDIQAWHNCFWDSGTCSPTCNGNGGGMTYGGTYGVFVCSGKTDVLMKTQSTFSAWDIASPTSIWDLSGTDYPRLWFEYILTLKSSNAATPVKTNNQFFIQCDYGKQLPNQCMGATHNGNPSACSFSSWVSSSSSVANLLCTAASSIGLKPNTCNILSYVGDARCHTASNTGIASTNVIQCANDIDCVGSSSGPKCNVAAGVCVSCLGAGDCASVTCKTASCVSNICSYANQGDTSPCNSDLCKKNGACVSGTCTGEVAKCSLGQVCEVGTGNCLSTRTCPGGNDDTMFRLYQPINSRVATYDNLTYLWSVCYSDIFGATYSIMNPHNCSVGNTNKILGINANYSALSEIPSLANFVNPVCYGDLSCGAVRDYRIVYYPFEGNSNDATGNLNNGIINGTTLINGEYGQGYLFNGVNNSIKIKDNPSLSVSNITVSLWVKPSNAGGSRQDILDKFNSNGGYSIEIINNQILCTIRNSTNWPSITYSGPEVVNGQWIYVVCSADGNYLTLFINGQQKNQTQTNAILTSTSNLTFGYSEFFNGYYFNGTIDDVRIWNVALNSNEVKHLNQSDCTRLTCPYSFGQCDPNLGERTVVSLYNETNVNASISSDSNAKVDICCLSPNSNAGIIGDAYFSNPAGNGINKTNVMSTVKLNLNKLGIIGKTINYTLYDATSGSSLGVYASTVAQSSNFSYVIFVPNAVLNYGFNASIINSSGVVETVISSKNNALYGTLNVTMPAFNDIPTTRIISPIDGNNYAIDDAINFNQISYDNDDDLNILWNFGDGGSIVFNDGLSGGTGNTTHVYSSSGTKIIGINVIESVRGQKAYNVSRIFVHKEGLNIFSIIDNPDYHNITISSGTYIMDGTSSYVDNCSYSLCPPGAGSCYSIISNIGTLQCKKIADSSMLNFTWVFDGSSVINTNNVPFPYYIPGPGQHKVNLITNYNY